MDDQDESQNVEDDRGAGGFRPIHGIGLGTLAVALIGGWLMGVSPLQVLGLLMGGGSPGVQTAPPPSVPRPGAEDPQLADSEGGRWMYSGVARIP